MNTNCILFIQKEIEIVDMCTNCGFFIRRRTLLCTNVLIPLQNVEPLLKS